MKKNGVGLLFIILDFLILYLFLAPLPAYAAGEDTMPPHLIQTVSEQEIYEGLLSLGMLECPLLEKADCEKAFENVKYCVVRVNMGKAHGSGIIWKMTPDRVIIATNRHVLAYWQDVDGYVYFPQGYYVDAQILGISEVQDIGFLEIDNGQFTYEELQTLREVSADLQVYESLVQGDEIFCTGSGSGAGETLFYEAEVEDTRRYIADFDAYMLYGYGYAKAGMSGGGIFDGYGHLLGMITGGTLQGEIAGVPLAEIAEAYAAMPGVAE